MFSPTITTPTPTISDPIPADEVESTVRALLGLPHEHPQDEPVAGLDELLIHSASVVDVSLGLVARFGAHVLDLGQVVRTIHANAVAFGASSAAVGAVSTLVELVRGGDHAAIGRALGAIDGRFDQQELIGAAAALTASGILALHELIAIPHADIYAELLAAAPAPYVGAGTSPAI